MDLEASPRSFLPNLPPGSRLLFIRLRSIGDIVLLTPALRLLKEWRADLRATVLVESRFRELLEGHPDVDEILGLAPHHHGAGLGDPATESVAIPLQSRLAVVRELRRRKFALCLNLHGGPTSTLLTRCCGAERKAGFAHFRASRLAGYHFLIPDARTILGQPAAAGQPGIHTAEHQASALFWLGLPRQEVPAARLVVSPRGRGSWRARKAAFGIAERQDYAVLHPTALYVTKQWSAENFARLGTAVERETGLAVVYSCGPGESSALDAVEQASRQAIRRLEGPPFNEFIAALAEARLFVGNDSGPAHLAAALGRPSVVIFGSSSSAIWGPWPRHGVGHVVQNYYECNPCPGDRCYRFERPECILSVSFDQVWSAARAALTNPKPSAVGSR